MDACQEARPFQEGLAEAEAAVVAHIRNLEGLEVEGLAEAVVEGVEEEAVEYKA